MARTYPIVSFGLFALAIKQDSTFECDDLQTFSKLRDLKSGNATSKPYITFEPDFWLLDGGYKFLPERDVSIHVGLMSLNMSDEIGEFTVPPVLTITFGQEYLLDGGIAIKFSQYSNDYCTHFKVEYYDDTNTLLYTNDYYPENWEFSTEETIDEVKKVVITFYSTNKPFRYLRVSAINFGELITFTNADIKSASVVEEINPISIELPINTLELELFSTNADFSIINPSGVYLDLQNKQPIDIYEVVDNETIYIGMFYLDKWENPSENEIKFSCMSGLGILEGSTYMGGIWLTPITVEDLILEIFEEIQMPYELDPDLVDIKITGWISICTYREALQQIAFAIGANVNDARSNTIQILKTTLASDQTFEEYSITNAEKGISQSLELKPLVTGVDVTAHNYVANTTTQELYKETLQAGSYLIKFSSPQHDLNTTGATIIESGANYAIITVASPETVTLTGQGYTDTTRIVSIRNTELDQFVKPNILDIEDATLINNTNVDSITQYVYDYYQQRYYQKVKLFAHSLEVGRSVVVDTLYNQQISGVTEKMSVDLGRGFISNAEILGVIKTS